MLELGERQREVAESKKRCMEAGNRHFGVDPQWGEPRFKGTLWKKDAGECVVGDWGCCQYCMRVLNKIDEQQCLVMQGGDHVLLLRGFDMSKVTDDAEFILQHPVWIKSTYSYTTVAGSSSTVFVMERDDKARAGVVERVRREAEEQAIAEEQARQNAQAREKLMEKSRWRTWTAAGGHQVYARFNGYSNGIASLQKEDGLGVDVQLDSLSSDDQSFIRNERWKDYSFLSKVREWADKTGVSTIDAALVELIDGTVTLRSTEYRIVTLPVDRLSANDQKHLEDIRLMRISAVQAGLKCREEYLRQHSEHNDAKGIAYERKFIALLHSELGELEKGNIPRETEPPPLPR